jgi:hypothetical protein
MTGTCRSRKRSVTERESQRKSEILGAGLRVWTRAAEEACPAMKDMKEGMRKFEGSGGALGVE